MGSNPAWPAKSKEGIKMEMLGFALGGICVIVWAVIAIKSDLHPILMIVGLIGGCLLIGLVLFCVESHLIKYKRRLQNVEHN